MITRISPQTKNKDRVNIFIDGAFVCGLDSLTVLSNRLKEGSELSEEELTEIQMQSEGSQAFEKSVKLIFARQRSEKEIRTYLKEKGYIFGVIDKTICKLKEYRYIDDEGFCRSFINDRKKMWGVKRLKMELKLYGISEEIIACALEEMGSQEDEAYAIAEKYLRQKKEFDYRKLSAFLFGKGFDSNDISAVMAKIKEEYNT